jgi:uncharacterized protein
MADMLDRQRNRPSPEYDSGIAFPAPTEELISEAGRQLARAAPGSEVFLFGSHARGEAGPDSDVDFLVIVPETDDEARESARLRRLLRELPFAMDIIVVSRAYAEQWRDIHGDVVNAALTEGKALAP